jgi:signal transduction histidine kinase
MRVPAFAKTVRFRLTVWYSSLLLVFGIAFVVSLNLAVRLDHPHVTFLAPTGQIIWTSSGVDSAPGSAINGYPQPLTPELVLERTEAELYSANLDRLRNWSLIAVVGLALASGLGGYVLSGMLLKPVRDITEIASEISATNLGRRINHQGPEDELWALSETFDSMIDRLETSFDRQRQFVQDASHELRTPLAAIRTNIDVTEMDPDATVEDYRELVETVKSQTTRLTRLSEDLLLLTSDSRSSVEPDDVDLGSVAREVVRQLGQLAASRDITLSVEGHPALTVETNGDLIYRCVFNLVDNAIKYSGAGSTVTLKVWQDGSQAAVAVADNGAGISPEDLARIFDRFYRVDKGRSRREGGSGLGLAIVQELVADLGGRVDVASTPGEGSTITIRLPYTPPAPATAPRVDESPRPVLSS